MNKLFDKILKDYLVELDKINKAETWDQDTLQRQGDLVTLIREHINSYGMYVSILNSRK